MSKQILLPDPIRFAVDFRQQSGVVAVQELDRLTDLLFDAQGQISYSVVGEKGEDGKAYLMLSVSGEFGLRCQRCLERVDWVLDVERLFQLVPPGVEIPDDELEDDRYDAIVAEPGLDVLALVEDEVLLSLPIAPVHESCERPRPEGGVAKESPFAALASLRGKDQGGQA